VGHAEDSATNLQTRFLGWQKALEGKGLKINAEKTETKVCSKIEEPLVIRDSKGKDLSK